MPKLDERLAAAELKVKQLKTRQRQLGARQRSIATKNQRSQDARRKIVVGAIVMAKVEAGEIDRALYRQWLDQALARADDRALFELPPSATDAR